MISGSAMAGLKAGKMNSGIKPNMNCVRRKNARSCERYARLHLGRLGLSSRQTVRTAIGADRACIIVGTSRSRKAQTKREHEEKQPHRDRVAIDNALMRTAVNPLHAVPEDRLAVGHRRLINGRCGPLLLQPRV